MMMMMMMMMMMIVIVIIMKNKFLAQTVPADVRLNFTFKMILHDLNSKLNPPNSSH